MSIDRYYTTAVRIEDFSTQDNSQEKPGSDEKVLEEFLKKFLDKFRDSMDDDFNTALAIGTIFELIRILNKYMDDKPSGQKAIELITKSKGLLNGSGNVLNIFTRTPEQWYKALMVVKNIGFEEEDILKKIDERQKARDSKDWETADTIRKELEEKGIILEDKKDRTRWKVRIS
jgi:cysteinyl-tRNA synthetase